MMSMDPDRFAKIVTERLAALGTSAFAVESAAGLPADSIRNVLRTGVGKSGPTLLRVAEICDALGLELYIGDTRESGTIAVASIDGQEYATIPLHEAELAAGSGAYNDDEVIIDHLAFRRDWLRRINVSASSSCVARVRGESMQPTIWAGDAILIDTTRATLPVFRRDPRGQRHPSIYALRDGDETRVKRLERPAEDLIMLISDNPDYPPELRPLQEIAIVGKVVWWGHTVRD